MVVATAATMLARRGHDVVWADGVAEEWTYAEFRARFEREAPALIAVETKTPVVQQHWRIVRELKTLSPATRIVLMGDHVTAFPAETMANSPVDYVLTGGEFDTGLMSIADHVAHGGALVPGIWYRDGDEVRDTGPFALGKRSYEDRPFFDRELTKWWLYGEHLYYRPSTYTMVGRDCWRPKCTFCSWTTLWPSFGTRSADSLLDEVGQILDRYPVREIFDDTGTFPIGAFLRRFCDGMVARGYDRRVYFSCNMRIDALRRPDYDRMARAGFRLVKLGIESANQRTLDRIDKGTSVEDLVRGCKEAKAAGLSPHLTTMVGYPWETRDEARRTLDMARALFADGHADTIQATVVMPYPGTPLFDEARREGWLKYGDDWQQYDMMRPVMHSPIPDDELMDMAKDLYGAFLSPRFVLRKILSVRAWEDVRYYAHAARIAVGHMVDFRRGSRNLTDLRN
jgi:anaerobic magnesium-protoporphyrin IX monomethyl ester cyclase